MTADKSEDHRGMGAETMAEQKEKASFFQVR